MTRRDVGKAWRFGLRPAWQKSRTASVAFVPPGNCAVVCFECLSMLTFRITVKAGLQRTTPNAASPIQAWFPLPRGGRVYQLAGGRRTLRHQTGSRGMEKVNAPSIASCRAFTETCERPFPIPGVGLPPKGNPISAARRSSVKTCQGWSIASSRGNANGEVHPFAGVLCTTGRPLASWRTAGISLSSRPSESTASWVAPSS